MLLQQSQIDLKCVIIGSVNAGKSCLVERFLHERWSHDVVPNVGAAFGSKDVKVGKETIKVGLWDTAGAERYQAMTKHFYRGAGAALICYDLTETASWKKVKFWTKELLEICENCILAIVGCKLDLITDEKVLRGVQPEEVQQYAATVNATTYETSSLRNTHVHKVFYDICEAYSRRSVKPLTENVPLLDFPREQ